MGSSQRRGVSLPVAELRAGRGRAKMDRHGPNWATTDAMWAASTEYMIKSHTRETWWPVGKT